MIDRLDSQILVTEFTIIAVFNPLNSVATSAPSEMMVKLPVALFQ
jgi:hypothetical protein